MKLLLTVSHLTKKYPPKRNVSEAHAVATYGVGESSRVRASLWNSEKEFAKRAKEFLKRFSVWAHRNKTLGELSAGQITRVMLVKAFLPYPKIVLLDEPTAFFGSLLYGFIKKFFLGNSFVVASSVHPLFHAHGLGHGIFGGRACDSLWPESTNRGVDFARRSLSFKRSIFSRVPTSPVASVYQLCRSHDLYFREHAQPRVSSGAFFFRPLHEFWTEFHLYYFGDHLLRSKIQKK